MREMSQTVIRYHSLMKTAKDAGYYANTRPEVFRLLADASGRGGGV